MEVELRILLLEASTVDAALIECEMRRGGLSFSAERVETRQDFIARLDGAPPDLVIADYKLPSFDGLQALNLVRERSPWLPFILVSGPIGEDGATEALKLGATDFVLKTRITRLLPCIERALREADDRAGNARLAQERERQRAELERSNADLQEFAYVASHDLKAPLRAIGHLAAWIQEDIEPTAGMETIDNLKLLQGRVTRLRALLDGLLAYSRIGREDSPVAAVDIGEVVRDIVAMHAPPAGFRVAWEGEVPVLRAHRMALQVVLENLIGNALKHHDRSEGYVTVATRKLDGLVEFRVSDDGPGIAERFHDKIFVIFQTLATRDEVESSGIGLAIVKRKVEGAGGRIWVESAPPARGTTFAFTWREAE